MLCNILTKFVVVTGFLDDAYDEYGLCEELQYLTEASERFFFFKTRKQNYGMFIFLICMNYIPIIHLIVTFYFLRFI